MSSRRIIIIGIEVAAAMIVLAILWSQGLLAYIGLGDTIRGIVSFKGETEVSDSNGNPVKRYQVSLVLLTPDNLMNAKVGGGLGYDVSYDEYNRVKVNDYVEGKIIGQAKMEIQNVISSDELLNKDCLSADPPAYCSN
jgi:hypothetical protein